ncbi:MAG TPA: glutamyl-tRNA reductase [Terriglobales bacterium]|nr:glutamyl-tRNA reductase [Terriglobales bacterium]
MEPALVVIGLNHRTAPIDVREHFWMNERRQQEALQVLTRSEGIEEAFAFSTCNRTEFVVWGDPTLAENSVLRFLGSHYQLKLCEWKNFYRLLDEQALAHAFRVSCGLDSMHIGEGQIGRQVNAAWQQAREAGCTGPYLDAMLRRALAVRRRVRKETLAGFNLESAPQAAVELAATIFGSLAKRNVVLLGAGAMGRVVAQALVDRGVESIVVLSRTDARSSDLSRRLELQTAPFSERYACLESADLVISAAAADSIILNADEWIRIRPSRSVRKQIIMDLALPRNVDPAVRQLAGVVLYDLDDLDRSVKPRAVPQDAEAEAERIVLAEVQAFRKQLAAEDTGSELVALHHRLDEICCQELESFRLEQGPFPTEQDRLLTAAISRISHKIAGSLMRSRNPVTRS